MQQLRVLIGLTCINMLNYIDRGIIPGAPSHFELFIRETLAPKSDNVYIGLLTSCFIASYGIFSIFFGSISNRTSFRPVSIGLLIWCLSAVLSGSSAIFSSFSLLLTGRILSGVGEASFQCIAPPLIDDIAPQNRLTLWLSLFYIAIPVGTALGFEYGALMASFGYRTWKYAFWSECLLMLPFSLILFNLKYPYYTTQVEQVLLIEKPEEKKTPGSTIAELLKNKVFLLIVMGNAVYTGSVSSLSTFGPEFFLGFEFFTTETAASSTFGAIMIFSGVIGTIGGGYALDVRTNGRPSVLDAMKQMILALGTGLCAILIGYLLLSWRNCFLSALAIGMLLMCSTTSCTSLVLLHIVTNPDQRALAISLNTFGIHLFGDVPSPILLGYLKDYLAPHCVGIKTHGHVTIDPRCRAERGGLAIALLIPVLWLSLTLVLWGFAYHFLKKPTKIQNIITN